MRTFKQFYEGYQEIGPGVVKWIDGETEVSIKGDPLLAPGDRVQIRINTPGKTRDMYDSMTGTVIRLQAVNGVTARALVHISGVDGESPWLYVRDLHKIEKSKPS